MHFSPSLFLLTLSQAFAYRPMTRMVTSADGTQIYADAMGDPCKQSIVFVHGFALSGVVFNTLFANRKLLDNFYLVRYDARGHGRSDKPDSAAAYTSIHYAQDFAAVMKAFNLQNPVFVGWSLGAAIVSDIVEHLRPMPLLGAVAFDGSPVLGPDILAKLIAPATAHNLALFFQDTDVTAGLRGRADFIRSCFEHPDQIPFNVRTNYLGSTLVQPPHISVLVTQREQDSTRLFAAGENGELHLLMLFGCSDSVAVEEEAVGFVKPHFTELTVNTIPGGHAVFEDNPDGTADALIKFIRKLPRKHDQ